MKHYLAIDLGAESGRVILGELHNGGLQLSELHRFLNQPVNLPTGLYWDLFRLFHEICEGLRIAGRERRLQLAGIAVDTWGVDFGLLGADGALIDNPRCYRDARNNGMLERTYEVVPKREIFQQTGLQFMQLNSLFQLHAIKLQSPEVLEKARTLLFTPDLLSYFLTGVAKNELTISSTSQMYNPEAKTWAAPILEQLGLPAGVLGDIVPPGTVLGNLRAPLAEFAGLQETPVYATASHDTAAAVAAVPATGEEPWCYISSGTWSLMGVELDAPLINDAALEAGLTNEVGAEGKIRLLKNIAGLWVLQECRRAWALEGQEYDYSTLAGMAAAAKPFSAVIHPDGFLEPGHMPQRIAEYCSKTGQPVPQGPAEMSRAILEGLALRYRQVLEHLESLIGNRIGVIHIVGGGSKNALLNQFVADATQRRVVAGPSEATAAGNILVQAMGAGELRGLKEVRDVVRRSFPMSTFLPGDGAGWDSAYARFLTL
jgi:rhamnulokinase